MKTMQLGDVAIGVPIAIKCRHRRSAESIRVYTQANFELKRYGVHPGKNSGGQELAQSLARLPERSAYTQAPWRIRAEMFASSECRDRKYTWTRHRVPSKVCQRKGSEERGAQTYGSSKVLKKGTELALDSIRTKTL